MAVYQYEEGQHPSGFIGIRVVRKVGEEYRQKYFNFRKAPGKFISQREQKRLLREANQLDKTWAEDAKAFAPKASIHGVHPNTLKVHSTGYTGLRATILVERKERAGELRSYYYPAFIGGTRPFKAFRISKYGYEKAWEEAAKYRFKQVDDPDITIQSVIGDMPDRAVFRKIRNHMKKQGHDIPLTLLKSVGL